MTLRRRLSLRGILTLGIAGLLSIFLTPAGSAFAAPAAGATTAAHDATVVVVRDITPAGCTLTYRDHIGQPQETHTSIACPAGTYMAVLHVSKSEAIAKHEAYVEMPSSSGTQAQLAQMGKQIDSLIAATNTRLHPSKGGGVSPASSCGLRSQSLSGGWVWGGDSWNSGVSWDTHSDCTIYITKSWVSGTASAFGIYWGQDKYAGWSQGRGCRYLGTNYLSANPNTVQSAGYGYEQWLYNGSNCTVFDDARYTYLSPLND